MGNFFKYAYQISVVLPAIIGAVREVAYALRSVFGSRSDFPAVSPLWPSEMDGKPVEKQPQGDNRGFISPTGALLGSWWILVASLGLAVLLSVSGCGASQLVPIATEIDVLVPDSAIVTLDGLEVGRGSIENLLMFENLPNYLRIKGEDLDVRLILVTCPGLEAIGVR